MARARDQTVTQQDLAEYLATQDDFALELYIYRLARELGLQASHGGTYTDPLTGKPRQYDVRASANIGNHLIALAIECKSLRVSYPLLISRVPRAERESFHAVIDSREAPPGSLGIREPLAPDCEVLILDAGQSLYTVGEPVGKSTAQVGRNERGELISADAEVFDKWSQALSSAGELIEYAEDAYERHGFRHFYTCVLPILVVSDDVLWIADYSEDGVLLGDPQQVGEATIFVDRYHSAPAGFRGFRFRCPMSHLHVFTRSAVRGFLEQVSKPGQLWESIFPKKATPRRPVA